MLQKFVHHSDNQIQTFRRDKTSNHRNHRNFSVLRKSEKFLQFGFVVAFAFKCRQSVGVVVVLKKIFVGRGIINIVVDAVDNAVQIISATSQKSVQVLAEILILNFLRVSFADGWNIIGVDNSAFHKVHRVIKFQVAVVEIFPVESENITHNIFRENTLIFQIVYGVDCFNSVVTFVAVMFKFQENRNKSGMPIVCIDDIGEEVDSRQAIQNGTAEKWKSLRVVVVAINAVTIKIFNVVNEIVNYSVQLIFINADKFCTPRNGNFSVVNMFHLVSYFFRNFAEFRENHSDIYSRFFQGFRKWTRNVGKSAGFDKWYCLRCDIKYFHKFFPPFYILFLWISNSKFLNQNQSFFSLPFLCFK